MLYRIDIERFLTHAIDHFDVETLTRFEYVVLSAAVKNGGRCKNVVKLNELYPNPDIVLSYGEMQDKKIFEKMYLDMLDYKKDGQEYIGDIVYNGIVHPIINHHDIVLIYSEAETLYIDVFCKFLKKNFHIEAIDLTKLFKEGHVGPIYIDRDDIRNRAVDVRRNAGKRMMESYESTSEGRFKLLQVMSRKDKIAKLKEVGVSGPIPDDERELNMLLMDAYVRNDEED